MTEEVKEMAKDPNRKDRPFDIKKVVEVIRSVVEYIVDLPFKTEFYELEDGSFSIQVIVNRTDYGKVLGREGRMASSLRNIINAISGTYDRRILINFSYPGMPDLPPEKKRPPDFWD